MKHLNLKNASLAAAAALLWVLPVDAQSHSARFDIPFQFVAGNLILPAGRYEITFDQFARLVVRNCGEQKVNVVALAANYETRKLSGVNLATLRFAQYGRTMLLTTAWKPGNSS